MWLGGRERDWKKIWLTRLRKTNFGRRRRGYKNYIKKDFKHVDNKCLKCIKVAESAVQSLCFLDFSLVLTFITINVIN